MAGKCSFRSELEPRVLSDIISAQSVETAHFDLSETKDKASERAAPQVLKALLPISEYGAAVPVDAGVPTASEVLTQSLRASTQSLDYADSDTSRSSGAFEAILKLQPGSDPPQARRAHVQEEHFGCEDGMCHVCAKTLRDDSDDDRGCSLTHATEYAIMQEREVKYDADPDSYPVAGAAADDAGAAAGVASVRGAPSTVCANTASHSEMYEIKRKWGLKAGCDPDSFPDSLVLSYLEACKDLCEETANESSWSAGSSWNDWQASSQKGKRNAKHRHQDGGRRRRGVS